MTKEEIMQILRGELPYLREKYGVEKIAIYGSFAKGSHTTKSDVDPCPTCETIRAGIC